MPSLAIAPSCLSIDRYIEWAATRWVEPQLSLQTPRLNHHLVMGLGLVGETAEVADVIEAWARTDKCDEHSLLKELGDVIYYWARLSQEFGLAVRTEAAPSFVFLQDEAPVLPALRLVKASGQIAELLKKYVRDGALDREKLQAAMFNVHDTWRTLCSASGLSWQDVLNANQAKVEGRAARGTTRGSGDNR